MSLKRIHEAPPLSADTVTLTESQNTRELRVSLTPNTEEDRGSPENRRAQDGIGCRDKDKHISRTVSKRSKETGPVILLLEDFPCE